MDTVIRELIVGAASHGLWSLLENLGVNSVQMLKEHLSKTDAVTQAVELAVASLADYFPLGTGGERARVVQFLQSPELESIVRQLYANRLVGKETASEGSTEPIKREFLALMSLHLDISAERSQSAADPLFHAIVTACNLNLARTVGQGAPGAHEALATYRHRRLLDELAVIARNMTVLAADTKPDIQSILAFEEKYRKQVGVRHSHIQPPHFDSAKKVPIDELFVAPKFFSPNRRKRLVKSGRGDIGIDAVAQNIYRLVIIGNPGGGKSTVANKLVHDMATRYPARPVSDRQLTPILVVLREYGRLKKAQNCSILQFIEVQANANYQVQPPRGAFEYLLLNGRLLVVFDGLDELLDTSYRQEVSADVESFCTLYPNVPVLVTSRDVGYEQAPLDEETFSLLRIAPFDDEQVSDYSEKWFARDDDYPKEQRSQKAKAFLAESEVAPDLRSNPLMLGLMCNLYKVEGYIPRNRADVYEKCSIMLFERWDKGRGIVVQLPFEAHIRPAMQHLAYWIYSEESLQGGVTREKLIQQTADYLLTWVFDDAAEGRHAADEFVTFCTGRAWVFTDTGTTSEGEKLFQFTHRTFLEYFTSSYLSSIHPTPEALGKVLQPRIRKEEWDVVALLAFQIQSRRVQGAADVLLKGLLDGWTSRAERAACIAFAGRCLESIVPSPKIRRAIAAAAVDFAVECGAQGWSSQEFEKRRRRRSLAAMVLSSLVSASVENRSTLAEVFHDRLLSKVLGSSEVESLAALEIALHPGAFEPRPHRPSGAEGSKFWEGMFGAVVSPSLSRLRELAVGDLALCVDGVRGGVLSIDDLLDWHGPAGLFKRTPYRCLMQVRGAYSTILIRQLLSCAIGDCSSEGLESVQKESASVGRWLLAHETPWIRSAEDMVGHEYNYLLEITLAHVSNLDELKPNDLGPDALFGAFCLFALVSELFSQQVFRRTDPFFRSLKGSSLVLIVRMASARSAPITSAKLTNFIGRCGLGEAQAEFIRRWIDGEVILTDVGKEIQLELLSEIQPGADEIAREDLDERPHDLSDHPS